MSPAGMAGFTVAMMSLVMLAGWLLRRRGVIRPDAVAGLSWIVVDLALPSLAFTQMARTADPGALRGGLLHMALCAMVLAVATLSGFTVARLAGREAPRSTIAFLVSLPNWVYLPLSIATALWGAPGTAAILWMNAAAQLFLWTGAIWILRGAWGGGIPIWRAVVNPGIVATVAGLAFGLLFPGVRDLLDGPVPAHHPAGFAAAAILKAFDLLGSMTIPLSFLVIGAQLAGTITIRMTWDRPLALTFAARLLVAPALTFVLLKSGLIAGWLAPGLAVDAAFLISCMPVAVTCGLFVERYGGDRALSARAILLTTLASLLIAPLLLAVLGEQLR